LNPLGYGDIPRKSHLFYLRVLIVEDAAALVNGGQVKRRSLRFYLLIVVLVSFMAALTIRVFDAYVQGNVWLAFDRRSAVGFPIVHILALIALVTCYSRSSESKEKELILNLS